MNQIKIPATQPRTPNSVPTANPMRVYYSDDVAAAGGLEQLLREIGSDQPKKLPELSFTEEEWESMLSQGL
ncbi:hypothetical protein AWR27_20100 [Spirosoma montaniterrae]|uniref:Uncharacterized protein n=1 Tax=Spirosoma montaniterrae TaxID=1178516 RepID=A0A1P9X1C1_9BACT|nr:hypothetical protein AWR27_20100 [Spirosoma montaniterrae]